MKRLYLLVLMLSLLVGCGDDNRSTTASLTTEQQLVALDTSGPLPKQDETMVRGYKAILDQLSAKYPGTSLHDLADLSVRGQGALEKHGIHVSIFDIIDGLNEATPSGLDNLSYKEVVAFYATLRANGMGHDEAIKGIVSFLGNAKAGGLKGV